MEIRLTLRGQKNKFQVLENITYQVSGIDTEILKNFKSFFFRYLFLRKDSLKIKGKFYQISST